jgi:hypothetical protein
MMSSIEKTQSLAEALRPLFRTWPAYNVGDGFILMATAFWERKILGSAKYPFDWDVAGKPLALLYGLSLPYFTLLLLLEYANDCGSGGLVGRILRSVGKTWEKVMLRWHGVREKDGLLLLDDGLVGGDSSLQDDDVESERLFVSENRDELRKTAPVVYENLWKVYPPSIGLFGVLVTSLRRSLAFVCCFFCRPCSGTRDRSAEVEERRKAILPKRAVRGVTAVIQKGETYALLGKNGAG